MLLSLTACKSSTKQTLAAEESVPLVGPTFNADSAWAYCDAQCAFGERVMNSKAHDDCGEWIARKFSSLGCVVELQKADLNGWDGKTLRSTNIIARLQPDATDRLLICAHWDARPWADNDPDSLNHRKPVMAANDGASGVGVMIELARIIAATDTLQLPFGIDFVCFDAEDYGAPYWADEGETDDTWALGAQHFASELTKREGGAQGAYRCGILLDMVGGQGARFYQEGFSAQYAQNVLTAIWSAAKDAGYSSFFISQPGSWITDDHKPLNDVGVPTVDIITFHPDCEQSSFGPTWHTINDTMENLDRNTLKAVGQTMVQYLYTLQ